jgi:uncharacterized protein (TIGR03437 family)
MRRTVLALALASLSALLAADLSTGYYRGRRVTFHDVNGIALYQGDIILGATAEIEAAQPASKTRESSTVGAADTWPGGVVPYEMDPDPNNRPNADVVQQAVDYWNSHTPIKLRAKALDDTNYVRFSKGASTISCSSMVGRRQTPGMQAINLPSGCGVGEAIHEIGHTIGLWHEMSRNDRNKYVTIEYGNIDKGSYPQFDQTFSEGVDAGYYDLNSIMHYGPYDFARDDLSVTIESVPAGIPMGQRDHLSAGDIDAVRRLYGETPAQTVITTNPSGLKVLVDGQLVDDGATYNWADGERHTIEAPFQGDDKIRYLFGYWSDGGAPKHDIIVSSTNRVYLANFIVQRKVTVTITPPGAGTVTLDPASPDGFYTDRSNFKITATPAAGYYFLRWSATPSRSMNPKIVNLDGRSVITNLEAFFADSPVTTITSNPPGRLIKLEDGSQYSTPVNFQWRKGESHTVTVDSTQPPFEHFKFTGWSDGSTGPLVINSSGDAATYTANFTRQHSLTTTVLNSRSSIRVDPPAPDGFYDEGTTVTLTPVPAGTSEFLRWTGDVTGATSPVTVIMDGQKEVRASFVLPSQIPSIVPVNAASNVADPFDPIDTAPGEIITIYGVKIPGLELRTAQVEGDRLATSLNGVQVLFNGQPGPLVYVSETQLAAITPYEAASRRLTTIEVRWNGQAVASGALNIVDAAPAIFTADRTGRGQAVIVNENGTENSALNPARRGSRVALFATGDGVQTPAMPTGQLSPSSVDKLSRPVLPVSVRIGGVPAIVEYAGAAPTQVSGLMQINVIVPDGIVTGPNVPIVVVAGDQSSPQGVTIAVE